MGPFRARVAQRPGPFDRHPYHCAGRDLPCPARRTIRRARVRGTGRRARAVAAVVARRLEDCPVPQFVLGDTRDALIRIAGAWRALFDIPLIAVTGSNGKTTTKEMIASILRAWLGDEATVATRGNLNNDIGVPLSLLRLAPAHR